MSRFPRVLLLMAMSLGLIQPAGAQVAVTQRDIDSLYHWAYSAAFGTGAYRVGEDEVFVLKVEPVIPLHFLQNRGVATRLRLPLTFGLQTIDLGDIGDIIDLSNNLQTVSFVPGMDFRIPIKGSWVLKPYVHYGYGWQMSGAESAQIYYFGLNSRVTLPALGDFRIDMINGLQWFGQVPDIARSDSFARLVTGFEGDLALGSWRVDGRQLHLKPHIAHYWYFNTIGFGQIQDPMVELKQEFEVGLAVGIEERISLKVMSFDRFGVAYRGGGDLRAIRIYLSSVFP
ncbi:MAG: hypothetical protein R3F07_15830 [Opitutaceae bacterium]